ncbi:Outer membrane protein TolC precursor [compost metagenome]
MVRETRAAYYNTEASLSRITAGRTAQASAEKARQATERAFELGVMNAVDVLNTIQEEYRARRDLLQAQYDFIMSELVLRRWSGTLVDDDIRKANEWLVAEAVE